MKTIRLTDVSNNKPHFLNETEFLLWAARHYNKSEDSGVISIPGTLEEWVDYVHVHCGDYHIAVWNTRIDDFTPLNGDVAKKDLIESILIKMWGSIGMDKPNNSEDIVEYCYEDVCDCADPYHWSEGDVAIAFRRWIEDQVKCD